MTTPPTQTLAVRFIGTGDAFGSGGRLQTCFCVESRDTKFLIDCGASSMVGLRTQGVDPDTLDAIVLTHFHGDHCAGVAFLLAHAVLVTKRQRPLVVAGPSGVAERITALWDLLFPAVSARPRRFELRFVELPHRQKMNLGRISVTAWPAIHAPETHPSIVRCEVGGKAVAYSGDTGWTEDLLLASEDADLLIAECYLDGTRSASHLGRADLAVLRQRARVGSILLTHASDEVLGLGEALGATLAYDGLVEYV